MLRANKNIGAQKSIKGPELKYQITVLDEQGGGCKKGILITDVQKRIGRVEIN